MRCRAGAADVCRLSRRGPVRRATYQEGGEMTRLALALVLAVWAAAAISPVAGADPTHAKNSTLITADCGGQAVTVSVNGNGEFTPAHDVNSTSVVVPTAFDLTFTFTPTGGAPEPETDTSSKAGPIK